MREISDIQDELTNMRHFMRRLYKLTEELPDFIGQEHKPTSCALSCVETAVKGVGE